MRGNVIVDVESDGALLTVDYLVRDTLIVGIQCEPDVLKVQEDLVIEQDCCLHDAI